MQKTLYLLVALFAEARSELSITTVSQLMTNDQINSTRSQVDNVLSKLESTNHWYIPNWVRWNGAKLFVTDKNAQELMGKIEAQGLQYNVLNFADADDQKLHNITDTWLSLAATTSVNQEHQMSSQSLNVANMALELLQDLMNSSQKFLDLAVSVSDGKFGQAEKALVLNTLPLAMRCKGGVTGALQNQPALGDLIFYGRVIEDLVKSKAAGAQVKEYSDADLAAQRTCDRSAIPTMSVADRHQLADNLQKYYDGPHSRPGNDPNRDASIQQLLDDLRA